MLCGGYRKIADFGSGYAHVRNFRSFHNSRVYYPNIYEFAIEVVEIR